MGAMSPTDGAETSADAKRHLASWQDEVDSVALYGTLTRDRRRRRRMTAAAG